MTDKKKRSGAHGKRSSAPAAALFTVIVVVIIACVAGIIWMANGGSLASLLYGRAAQVTEPAPTETPGPPTAAPTTTPTAAPTAPADITPSPTTGETPTAEPTGTPGPFDGYTMPYYLYLEKGSFTLTVYARGDGDYTQVFKTYLTAIGKGARTPTGVYTLGRRDRWHSFGADQAYTQYATNFEGRLYIHGPLYRREDVHSMYNNTYREIGTAVTAGCLRTATEAARWIYENCAEGTRFEIVNGAPRGTQAEPWPDIERIYNDPTDVEAG